MRIVRFIDDKDRICYGRNYDSRTAELLEGDIFTGLNPTV
jgi:hypothetical protein